MALASQFAFHHANAPQVVLRRGRLFIEMMALQGALGYLQYFLHDAAWVVEFHLAGATTLWITGLGFFLSLHRHPPQATEGAPADPGLRTPSLSAPEMAMTGISIGSTSLPTKVERPETHEVATPELPWLVIVWNDPINLMSYVTYVFQELFGYSRGKAHKLMLDVHYKGRAVVSSGPKERAELDVARLHQHGLWATIEHGQ